MWYNIKKLRGDSNDNVITNVLHEKSLVSDSKEINDLMNGNFIKTPQRLHDNLASPLKEFPIENFRKSIFRAYKPK